MGFLELHMLDDARAERAQISHSHRQSPEAIAVDLEIGMVAHEWQSVVRLASQLAEISPAMERPWIAWAYALRELQRVPEAQAVLLRGEKIIANPTVLVDYNLACYFCLLGNQPEARKRLARVFAKEPGWKIEARRDPDFAGLDGGFEA